MTASKIDPAEPLEPEVVKWLFESAKDQFKTQADLDESVWRSMSFVAALFALSIAVFRDVEPRLQFTSDWWHFAASVFYCVGIASFGLAFGYLARIVWDREFLHPPRDLEVIEYARKLAEWKTSAARVKGKPKPDLLPELHSFMANVLATANERNLQFIRTRLVGRSRTILLLLFGFGCMSVCEAISYFGEL